MSFTISGLSPEPFRYFSELSDEALRERNIIRRIADSRPGFPCRITLEGAEPGETVFLLNHESHSASTPYASRYAIYVRENAATPALFRDELPPVFVNRPIALRLFDSEGMLIGADMGTHRDLAAKIEQAFARADVSYIHAHNAMHGCFVAEVRRAD
jgi:Protein of unknown function (DUF1203)